MWVIAETTDLPKKFAKIVVTDSSKVQAVPGRTTSRRWWRPRRPPPPSTTRHLLVLDAAGAREERVPRHWTATALDTNGNGRRDAGDTTIKAGF